MSEEDSLLSLNVNAQKATIIFGGDVSFSGITRRKVESGKCTYNGSFDKILKYFKEADKVVVNLENVVVGNGKMEEVKAKGETEKLVTLMSEEDSLLSLKYAGIDYVTVANNHLVDHKDEGIRHTTSLLEKYDIEYTGVLDKKETMIIEANGVSIGIAGFCLVEEGCGKNSTKDLKLQPTPYSKNKALKITKALASKVDIVVAFLHWGEEYTVVPDIMAPTYEVVHALSETCDVIVGSHAHVTQPHYFYRNTLVVQQLGNLLFPMHLSTFSLFDNDVVMEESDNIPYYESWWYQYTKRFKNKAAYSRLFKLVFNGSGLVKEECRYMDAVNELNKNHCLFIDPIMRQSSPWRRICDDNDENCIGVEECNQFECTVPKLGGKGGTEVIQYTERYWKDIRDSKIEKSEEVPTEPVPLAMEFQ